MADAIDHQRSAADAPVWSPDGTWIAYISDHDGDEQWDIFLVSPKTGDVVNLTTSPESAEEEPAWSPDGRQIAYVTKPKTGSSFEIELMDVATRHVRHLTKNTPKELSNYKPDLLARWQVPGLHAVARYRQGLERLCARPRQRREHQADAAPRVSTPTKRTTSRPTARRILITSDAQNGYDNVGLLDIATKKIDWLTSEKWRLRAGTFSPDGKSLTWTANVDGNTDIYLYDLASRHADALPLKKGVNSLGGNPLPYSRDGSKLLYYHNGADAPNDLWVCDIARSSRSR